jgi:hypothetical protein
MSPKETLILIEQVLSRHLMREFADRNRLEFIKPLTRTDLRDAVTALRIIKTKLKNTP